MKSRPPFYLLNSLAIVTAVFLIIPVRLGATRFAPRPGPVQSSALPAPTGAHPVGTAILHLKDASRRGGDAPSPDGPRELMVQIWYPAEASRRATPASYIPDPAMIPAMKKESYNDLSPEVLDGWRELRTHSVLNEPVVKSRHRLPLLFFSHGFGMSRSNYTSIIEDLASHGYVVAAIDHPHTGFTRLPDGRVLSFAPVGGGADPEEVNGQRIEDMARDASFTLDFLLNRQGEAGRFAGRIDPKRVGMLGHSLGGAAALGACQRDARFRACADLDGDLWGKMQALGLGRPFLVMLNEPPESRRPPAAMREQRDKGWADFISRKKTTAFVVKIGSTSHFSFSDFPFVVPEALMKKQGAEIPPRRGLEIMTKVLRAFFSEYLGRGKGGQLRSAAGAYPEVTLKAFDGRRGP